jgi:hypothetical protein
MTRTFSLWFLVATAGLFCLQWFPLTGVFLMLAGAPLWSIALVNLAMIGVAFEALTAFVPR